MLLKIIKQGWLNPKSSSAANLPSNEFKTVKKIVSMMHRGKVDKLHIYDIYI